jgi:hypothetical protein
MQQVTRIKVLFDEVTDRDIEDIDFCGDPLEGSTEEFVIIPTILQESGETYLAVYGIYNVRTGMRETETRQYNAAKEWAKALTKTAKGGALPGLEPEVPTGSTVEELGSA